MPALVRMRLALEYLFSQEKRQVAVDARFSEAVHLDITRPAEAELLNATVRRLLDEGFVTKVDEQSVETVNCKKTDAQIKYIDHLASIWDHVGHSLPRNLPLLTIHSTKPPKTKRQRRSDMM
jgi:hypothetical protein